MLRDITDWILSLHGWVALAIVFLVPALEASAFLGFVFPGEIAVILGGVLSYEGQVRLPAVVAAAVAGAIVGDTVGYFIGRRWGRQILRGVGRRVPFLRHRIDDHLESAKAYLSRRGGTAVFFGRFTATLRVLVPGLAGMADMPYRRFAFFNVAGGLLWGTGFVLLGYVAGAAWRQVAADAGRIGFALLVLVLVGLVLGRVLRGIREHGEPLADRLARIAPVAWIRRKYPRSSGWLARRIDTDSPRGFALSLAIVAGIACAWLFLGLTQDVLAHEEAALSDPSVTRFVVGHRAAWTTGLMEAVTWLGSSAVLIGFVVGLGAYLLLRRDAWRSALLLIAALVGANILCLIVKPLVARSRPPEALHLIKVSGYAFPAGEIAAAMAVWGMATVLLSAGRPARQKRAMWFGLGFVTASVAFSRVYLGVQWWTDVVAGIALGGAWLCLLGVLFLRFRAGAVQEIEKIRRRGFPGAGSKRQVPVSADNHRAAPNGGDVEEARTAS